MSNRGGPPSGLTSEPAMRFRPSLAARIGLFPAIVMERAHERQRGTGQTHRVRRAGQDVSAVCFRWPLYAQLRDFPFQCERTVRTTVKRLVLDPIDSTSNADAAESLSQGQPLLWRFSVLVAGRVSKDWYSVNYAAVGDSSQLFPTAAVDPAEGDDFTPENSGRDCRDQRQGLPLDAAIPAAPDGNPCRSEMGGKGGEDQGPLSSSIQLPSERARLLLSGEICRSTAEAIVLLAEFKVAEGAALDLLAGFTPEEGLRRARVMADNARRLLAAGFEFDRSAEGFVMSGIRGGWHHQSDEEVRKRAARQRAKRAGKASAAGDFNVRPAAEVAKELAETRRHRELEETIDQLSDQQWQMLAEKIRPQWEASDPGRPFPADSRRNTRVRALAREYLGGPPAMANTRGAP